MKFSRILYIDLGVLFYYISMYINHSCKDSNLELIIYLTPDPAPYGAHLRDGVVDQKQDLVSNYRSEIETPAAAVKIITKYWIYYQIRKMTIEHDSILLFSVDYASEKVDRF